MSVEKCENQEAQELRITCINNGTGRTHLHIFRFRKILFANTIFEAEFHLNWPNCLCVWTERWEWIVYIMVIHKHFSHRHRATDDGCIKCNKHTNTQTLEQQQFMIAWKQKKYRMGALLIEQWLLRMRYQFMSLQTQAHDWTQVPTKRCSEYGKQNHTRHKEPEREREMKIHKLSRALCHFYPTDLHILKIYCFGASW